jgi:glycosyltransferase involved in cell wall biosynthesis
MTELQAGNGNAWESRLMGRPYILLGHGAPYTSHPNRVSEAFEGQLNRRAVHVLTYVPSGRLNVLRDGKVNPAKVTAFMNTTDTRRLADLVSSVSANNVTAFRNDLRIPNTASVALYVGSLTSAKRIDLLCAAAELVLSKHPNTHLIIAGDGPDRHLFEPLRTRYGRVHLLGQSDAQGLALVGAASSFLLNPGRIGLVAVDALVLGLQVLSTRYAFHAPERDYLEEGNTVFYSEDTPADFAELWSHALAGTLPSTRPKWIPTIDHAIETIGQAIIGSLRVSVVSR